MCVWAVAPGSSFAPCSCTYFFTCIFIGVPVHIEQLRRGMCQSKVIRLAWHCLICHESIIYCIHVMVVLAMETHKRKYVIVSHCNIYNILSNGTKMKTELPSYIWIEIMFSKQSSRRAHRNDWQLLLTPLMLSRRFKPALSVRHVTCSSVPKYPTSSPFYSLSLVALSSHYPLSIVGMLAYNLPYKHPRSTASSQGKHAYYQHSKSNIPKGKLVKGELSELSTF